MSPITRFILAYARFFGGDEGPAGLVEQDYLGKRVPPNAVVVDLGGGEGKLANRLARKARLVAVVDREQTDRKGADNSIYNGCLKRLKTNRSSPRVVPVLGDAMEIPLNTRSVDAIVSSQFLEHVDSSAKLRFFRECARCLKPNGILAISTPNAEFFETHAFRFSRLARRLISKQVVARLPVSLRGPWLEQTPEEWEVKAGHYDHGCRPAELERFARQCGFTELDRRHLHTRVTCFCMELMFTFPLVALAASPIVRLAYALEYRLAPRPGVNLLISFQRQAAGPIPAGEKFDS